MTSMLTRSVAEQATARLHLLLDDPHVFEHADGVVVARGRIGDTEVLAFSTDATVQGGALGEDSCRAIAAVTDQAVRERVPVVGIWHSGGARLREGVSGLHAVGQVFAAQVRASGQVPQISVVLGPAAGGAAYGPALTDVIVMGPQGRVLVTGPDVVRTVTGQDVDAERLGGPETHARSGVVHIGADTDAEALQRARLLVDLLGRQGEVDVRRTDGPDPGALVPSEHRLAYDVRPVVRAVVDPGTFLEVQEGWARNVVTGLARLAGRTVGVVANNPIRMAGCLDASSGDKAGRFVQWCDGNGVPLVFLVDVPGYLPGVGQEDAGVVRRGAKLLHAYAACVVPRLTVVLRKSFGGAFIAMGSKGLGADAVFAWPGAQVDVMGASAAVEVLHRRELAAEPDPVRRAELVLRLSAAHEATTGGLGRALGSGVVDEILAPEQTRARLVTALAALPDTRGRHRNPPL
ncbi:MAG: acyl-CoA carboxylase subunit beta [Frankiales bacterium]|nr:MAG: acyl-CoA carboxylase subunit beta [Frankiales bacterium]